MTKLGQNVVHDPNRKSSKQSNGMFGSSRPTPLWLSGPAPLRDAWQGPCACARYVHARKEIDPSAAWEEYAPLDQCYPIPFGEWSLEGRSILFATLSQCP